jgi:AraC family transcriptional regulator of adaptative response/methylated-DNA-[protein]-cysteine methyltransferase
MKRAAPLRRMILHGSDIRPAIIPAHGLALRYGEAPCPFGICRIADSVSGICHLSFADQPDGLAPIEEIHRDWPEARVTVDHPHAQRLAQAIFAPAEGTENGRPLLVSGTPFQIATWRLLIGIPAGTTTSYAALAGKLGKPGATRATGSAVGANRLAWLIPCHRVVPSTGGIGGYRWGAPRKAAMLAWEAGGC